MLGDPTLATYGIIAAGLWPQTAYCMILYLTGLNAVDPEQVEAARLDGAKGWKMLWYVILPQLKPATFIAFVVTIIGALRSFDLISIMTNGGPFGTTRVLSFYMFEKALSEYGFRMGYGAAIAVVLFLIMLVFIAYFLWSMYQEEKGAADVPDTDPKTPRAAQISLPGVAAHRADRCGLLPLIAVAVFSIKPDADFTNGNYWGMPGIASRASPTTARCSSTPTCRATC